MRRSEKGYGSLVAMLITCAIILILVAALTPNLTRKVQALEAEQAAEVLARINKAELTSAQAYQGYLLPSALAQTNLANPLSACNPELISGADAQTEAVNGYTFTFTQGANAATPTCTPNPGSSVPATYLSYAMTAGPANKSAGSRYFYTDNSGVIHVNDGAPATAASPVYAINALGGLVNSSGGSNDTGCTVAGTTVCTNLIWASGNSYAPGQEVFVPASADGLACNQANSQVSFATINGEQYAGPFFNLDGLNNNDPCVSPNPDWSGFGQWNSTISGAGTYTVLSFTLSDSSCTAPCAFGAGVPNYSANLTASGPVVLATGFAVQSANFVATVNYFGVNGTLNFSLPAGGSLGPTSVTATGLNFTVANGYDYEPYGSKPDYPPTGGTVVLGTCSTSNSGYTTAPYTGILTVSCPATFTYPNGTVANNNITENLAIYFRFQEQP